MKKVRGINFFSLAIWAAFISLGGWFFGEIVSDMEGGSAYYPLILGVCGCTFLVFLLKEIFRARKAAEQYALFEANFPELKNSVADLEEEASYFNGRMFLAIYKDHFISNWQIDWVDLRRVERVSYGRTAGVKSRTGTVAGNQPILVFTGKHAEQKTIYLSPLAPLRTELPKVLQEIAAVNPNIRFGKEGVGLSEYLSLSDFA